MVNGALGSKGTVAPFLDPQMGCTKTCIRHTDVKKKANKLTAAGQYDEQSP